jgi:type II secretory pathway pseudopilin PulG
MRIPESENRYLPSRSFAGSQSGFSLVEVIVAGTLMIVLCVGLLTVFSYVTNINRGNNVRTQALSALQQEIEYYRSLKFVPGQETAADLPNHRSAAIYAGQRTRPPVTSASGMVFNINVEVTNLQFSDGSTLEEKCTFKEITIQAVPAVTQGGWLSDDNLKTSITMQRVRAN